MLLTTRQKDNMTNQHDKDKQFDWLRQQLEELLLNQPGIASRTSSDILELIHELKISHTDLEIQNQELKRAQEKISSLHQEYENLYEFAPCGYLTINPQGLMTRANQTAATLLGTDRSHLLQSSFIVFIDPDWLGTYRSARIRALETGQPQCVELLLKRFKGQPGWFLAHIHADQDNTGSLIQLRVVLMDITGYRRREGQTRQKERDDEARQNAERDSRHKSQFLANMSHEIRTPLNGILGMQQLLGATNLDGQQQAYVDMTIQSANRLSRLLNDVLDLIRIEEGKIELCKVTFQLADVLQSVETTFADLARDQDITLKVHMDEAIPASITGDSTRLTQILFNLAGNAVKFTTQGSVNLQAHLASHDHAHTCRILFTVSDTGPGISLDQIETVFETFSQAGNGASPYTRQYQGAGLGLPLVKRLVDFMGGNLAIDSLENEGTTFYVNLPFTVPEAAHKYIPEEQHADPFDGPLHAKVLLVDDDSITRFYVQSILEDLETDVAVAENGQQALEQLHKAEFDCILLDIQMPVMDGVELTRRIRALNNNLRDIHIIAMTAYAMEEDKEHFLEAGMDDYLAKPVNQQDMIAVIRKYI